VLCINHWADLYAEAVKVCSKIPAMECIKKLAHLIDEMTKQEEEPVKKILLQIMLVMIVRMDEWETVENFELSQKMLVDLETMEQIFHTCEMDKSWCTGWSQFKIQLPSIKDTAQQEGMGKEEETDNQEGRQDMTRPSRGMLQVRVKELHSFSHSSMDVFLAKNNMCKHCSRKGHFERLFKCSWVSAVTKAESNLGRLRVFYPKPSRYNSWSHWMSSSRY
jgi:hypothetical protein